MSKKHDARYQLVHKQRSGWTIVNFYKHPPKKIPGGYMDHKGKRFIGNYKVVDTFKSEGKTSWKQSVFTTQTAWTVLVLLILSVTITVASMFAASQ